MLPETPHPIRLYSPDEAAPTPCELATRELLRPALNRGGGRDLEPLSRGWFEEIEHKRYARAGEWLPRVLEFSRHRDETLLMAGPGLGSDALQYTRHETRVTMAVTTGDSADAIRRNFELRGLEPKFVTVDRVSRLPFDRGCFDLAYLNTLHTPALDLATTVDELYRVLKPGGKLFALIPAWYDVDRWQKWLLPFRQLYRSSHDPLTGPKQTAREVRRLCQPFEKVTLLHRHLRRSELPHVWRLFPLSWLERLAGRILAVRATKPISPQRATALPAAA
ncbi:class I SAM-dependent methyltransferase [Limnoglobus roseus]|uniref:Class I SAM-dependent methyltransferase n=1 Tax=Limnoglobus roseus TaxID=2598579 RepID=A0A5C1AEH1_9BACT|nr:class I SAM-dependent methyltransferase [Limnoglobus roseus]QEL16593.1 class I SAM-dependent methyltransferase [Limnoglobus roseus]